MKTEKLFFTKDAIVDKQIIYHAGKSYDVPVETGSAQRWIKRGVAHTVVEEKKLQETMAAQEIVPQPEIIAIPEPVETLLDPEKEVVPEQSSEEMPQEVQEVVETDSEEHPTSAEDVAKQKPKKENKNKKNPGKGL